MDEQFFNECISAVSAVVGTANGLPPDQRPFCFMQNRDDYGFVFCFSDHWHKDMEGTWPITSFDDSYSTKAAGFLLLHELTLAERTVTKILEEDGKHWEDLGLGKKSVLYAPGAAREIVESGKLCDVDRWDEAFNDARRRQTAMVSASLTIKDNGDGTYSAGHVEQEGDDGEWFYYLDEAIKHESGQGTNLAFQGDTVVLLVGDAYGNEWEVEVPVSIRDDVPEMSLGNKQDFSVVAGHEEHASGIIFNFGADDAAGKKLEIIVGEGEDAKTVEITDTGKTFTVNGELGVLTINPDGTYSYKANTYAPGKEGGTDKFTFKITDADGDTVTVDINGKSSLQFTVEMPPAPELSSRIDEREGVTNGKPANIEIPDGYHIISGGDGAHGTISQIAGSWVYILNEALNHGGENDGKNVLEPGDTVTVRVGDEYGNEWSVEVPVAVVDDVPAITMAEDISVTAGETGASTGAFTFDFGADNGVGKTLTVKVDGKEDTEFTDITKPMTVAGKYGTLTINPDGTYSYKADGVAFDAELPKDEFTFVIKDADGDIASVDDDGNPRPARKRHPCGRASSGWWSRR